MNRLCIASRKICSTLLTDQLRWLGYDPAPLRGSTVLGLNSSTAQRLNSSGLEGSMVKVSQSTVLGLGGTSRWERLVLLPVPGPSAHPGGPWAVAVKRHVARNGDTVRLETCATSGRRAPFGAAGRRPRAGRNESPLKRAEEQLREGWSTGPKRTGLKQTKPRERGSTHRALPQRRERGSAHRALPQRRKDAVVFPRPARVRGLALWVPTQGSASLHPWATILRRFAAQRFWAQRLWARRF